MLTERASEIRTQQNFRPGKERLCSAAASRLIRFRTVSYDIGSRGATPVRRPKRPTKRIRHAPIAAPRRRPARQRGVDLVGDRGRCAAEHACRHRAGGDAARGARQRLFPRQLHADHRLAAEGGGRERSAEARQHRQDRRRARPVDGDRLLARQHRQAGALPPGRAAARTGKGPHRRAGARAGARRQGGRVDRRRHPRDRGGQPAGASPDHPRSHHRQRSRDAAPAGRHHRLVRVGQSGRRGAGRQLVHAAERSQEAQHRYDPGALPEICRP